MLDYFQFYLLPLAIKIGMTPKQFWDDDPDDFFSFWSAYQLKKKDELIEANIKAFNQGKYFLYALRDCLQFSKHPKQIYPKEPFKLNTEKKKPLTRKEYQNIRQMQLQEMERRFNAQKNK